MAVRLWLQNVAVKPGMELVAQWTGSCDRDLLTPLKACWAFEPVGSSFAPHQLYPNEYEDCGHGFSAPFGPLLTPIRVNFSDTLLQTSLDVIAFLGYEQGQALQDHCRVPCSMLC